MEWVYWNLYNFNLKKWAINKGVQSNNWTIVNLVNIKN